MEHEQGQTGHTPFLAGEKNQQSGDDQASNSPVQEVVMILRVKEAPLPAAKPDETVDYQTEAIGVG